MVRPLVEALGRFLCLHCHGSRTLIHHLDRELEVMRRIRLGHCIQQQRQARSVSSTSSSVTLLEDSFWVGSLCAFQVIGRSSLERVGPRTKR